MRRLARRTIYSTADSLDRRVEQLERRVNPLVIYGGLDLQGGLTLTANTTIDVPTDPATAPVIDEEVNGLGKNYGWRPLGGDMHIPNIGSGMSANPGGGWYRCSAGVDMGAGSASSGFPYTVDSQWQTFGTRIRCYLFDSSETEIAERGPAFSLRSVAYQKESNTWQFRVDYVFDARIALEDSAPPPDGSGYHHHFRVEFDHDLDGAATRSGDGVSLIVVRYGDGFDYWHPGE